MKYHFLIAIGLAAIIGGIVWYQTMVWDECREAGHSFAYCFHIAYMR